MSIGRYEELNTHDQFPVSPAPLGVPTAHPSETLLYSSQPKSQIDPAAPLPEVYFNTLSLADMTSGALSEKWASQLPLAARERIGLHEFAEVSELSNNLMVPAPDADTTMWVTTSFFPLVGV
jgi:hypothetical protein